MREAEKSNTLRAEVVKQKQLFKTFLDRTTQEEELRLQGKRGPPIQVSSPDPVWSVLKYRLECPDPSDPLHGKQVLDPIETLAGILRDRAACARGCPRVASAAAP